MERPSVPETLMAIAQMWERRSTCSRNQVGAVIALDGRTLSSGYNGAPAGVMHCEHESYRAAADSAGCKIAIHAEANAIAYAARHGVRIELATLYTTLSPCYACAQLIIGAGLMRVVYHRSYRDMDGVKLLGNAGVIVESWT